MWFRSDRGDGQAPAEGEARRSRLHFIGGVVGAAFAAGAPELTGDPVRNQALLDLYLWSLSGID